MSTHVLILSVSAGAGHVRAAQALEAAAKAARPALQATHLDLLALVPKEFRKLWCQQGKRPPGAAWCPREQPRFPCLTPLIGHHLNLHRELVSSAADDHAAQR